MARPRKARLEGEVSKGEAEFTATQLDDAVELFKARFPDEWEAIRLCPLQHGLDVMAERLARG
jgi:hypothetical protein